MTHLTIGSLLTTETDIHGKGKKIAAIAQKARSFNASAPGDLAAATAPQAKEAMNTLEEIARLITEYVSWRSPYALNGGKPNKKRIDKWDQLDRLKNDVVAAAAKLGGKMMNAPAAMKDTTGNRDAPADNFYWLEWFMPVPKRAKGGSDDEGEASQHHPRYRGQELSQAFKGWLDGEKQRPTERGQSFWAYLKTLGSERLSKMGDIQYSKPKTWETAEYRGGRWIADDDPLGMSEETLIAVPFGAPDGMFLYAPGEKGMVHHSSLVMGRPVRFIGNFTMDDGKFDTLELHSGHYQPTLASAQKWLDGNRDKLNGIEVKPFHK